VSPLLAVLDLPALISLAIGVFGVGGLIFTALRYRRDDTTAIVNQQNVILSDMKTLNDELRKTADDLRGQRDALQIQVEQLTAQVSEFEGKLDG
jgi:hypothetical protein